ncbi:MAG: DUF1592 domain-containing protein [Gammaproteobacteria bacterium]
MTLLTACQPSGEPSIAQYRATLGTYCIRCHNYVDREADLMLDRVDLANIEGHPEIFEKMARKLRTGQMPPAGGKRPDAQTYKALTEWLEGELDRTAVSRFDPPGLHRLNRAEYANAVRDLLALEVDATQFLPADDSSRGFDNQAGTLGLSPALLEAYLSAAGKISRLSVGNATKPTQTLYRVAEDANQNYHVDGLPFGTRGGTLIEHFFPADGEYIIRNFAVTLGNMGNFRPFGDVKGEQLEILIDGERVGQFDWDYEFNVSGSYEASGQLQSISVRVPVKAGLHKVGVTFLATNYAPGLDLNHAFERTTIETGGLPGFTFYPHLGSVRIEGPFKGMRPTDTPSRRKVFVCTPSRESEGEGCASRIATTFARRAYRGLVDDADVETLMSLYRSGRAGGDFDSGIEMIIQRALSDPKFIYRAEVEPAGLAVGDVYPISDLELASRLSFFLWSSIPDNELLELAEHNRLSSPGVLETQVRRMLADERSRALTKNFAGQWLGLRALEAHTPIVELFPDFDDNLRQAFRRETELFFDSILREDRSVIELLTANHTFVNERLAKHYGIPKVRGSRFRRVELSEDLDIRRGLLGKGSILTVSSVPARTSPVIRGNWMLLNLLGTPAPDPPPDIPDLEPVDLEPAGSRRQPTIREQLEAHQNDPVCSACHKIMDPFGFAMEHFDAIGRWRDEDGDSPINTSSFMYDGTSVSGPADLREFFVKYSGQFVRVVTEKLLTYALGRGVEYYDMPVVRSIIREAASDNYRLSSLILEVIKSDPFLMNMKNEEAKRAKVDELSAYREINLATTQGG